VGARSVNLQGQRLFQRRVGQAQFERRTTIVLSLEIMVGRRGEAPLVPPYIQPRFKKALALMNGASSLALQVGVPRLSVEQCRAGGVQQLNLPRVDGNRGSKRRHAWDESLD